MNADTTTTTANAQPRGASTAEARKRSWRPAKIHRVADLSPRAHVAFVAVIVALALLPLLSAAIVLSQGWRPSGDNALIGLRAQDVLHGHLPLVGQPSTGENFGSGIESSHPGPIEFYLIAPFVLLMGASVGLAVGAAAINSAALVGIGWLAMRRGGIELMLVATVAATLLSRSLGGNFLHDPVSSNIGALMALCLLFASWSIIAGDLRTMPVFVFVGTFTLQDHLTYLGTGAPVILVAIVIGTWWIRRTFQRSTDSSWLRSQLWSSVAIAAVLWLPVLLDQLLGSHNITSILQTFTTSKGESAGRGVGFAAGRVAEALAPWPIFSRRVAPLGWLHTPATHEWITGYLVLLAVVAFGIFFFRLRRTDLTAMVAVVVVAAGSGFATAMKLPEGAAVKAANLRWMWTVSAFAWIALVWLVWKVLPVLWKEVLGVPSLVFGSTAVVVAMAAVVSSSDLSTDRDGAIAKDTTTLIANVEREVPEGRYRVKYAGGSVVLSIGPALVHDLEGRGDDLYLDIGPFNRAYGDHRTYSDQEIDGTLLVTAEADAEYPEGTRLVGRQRFRVNSEDERLTTVRVYLVDDAP